MVSLGQSNSKEIFTGGGRLYAAGFNRSVFERMYRERTSLSANCSRKCRSSGSVCSALRMWTKPAARSSSPSRRPMPPCTSRKNASGQHRVLTQTTKISPGFLLILQEHRERFFCYFSAGSRCFSVNGARGFHYANLLRCGRGRRS